MDGIKSIIQLLNHFIVMNCFGEKVSDISCGKIDVGSSYIQSVIGHPKIQIAILGAPITSVFYVY